MAQGSRGPPPATMPTNGTATHNPAPTAVNRKKQKRREKEAAKKAAQELPAPARNGVSPAQQQQQQQQQQPPPAQQQQQQKQPPPPQQQPQHQGQQQHQKQQQHAHPEQDEPRYDEGTYYSDDEYEHAYAPNGDYQQSYNHAPVRGSSGKKSRRKKKATPSAPPPLAYSQHLPSRQPPVQQTSHSVARSASNKDRIWNTSTAEERERIRDFWLSLGEDERKSLVKIEKEAVLRKMKEQQKHSCSCTVCGRKRTAIEEELEVLYDAYYEELEHAPHPRPMLNPPHSHGPYDDDEEEYDSGEEDDEEDSDYDSEISSEGDYSSGEPSLPPPEPSDFLQFGSSLQVKGGILTVADDLLKNDGKKFIEMMEQLAERRMQREEEAQFSAHPNMQHRSYTTHSHNAPPPADDDDDYDDEGEDDDDYDDDEYDEDEDDEEGTMTEEQRMEEGRRMFQIFAARMFEQRVLQAYREKVAAERQQRLLEELAEEDIRKDAKEAKKAKEAQKRKEKKDKQRQQKAEEKARKEAELAAKEAEAKAAEEKRLEEQRKKREEQRKKKEAERKAQEEEKQRKEAERLKRQQEERERQQEAERKAREQKALEKKAKDEAKRKEREEREAREKEAREKKAQEERDRKEREAKSKAENKDRPRIEDQAAVVAAGAAAAAHNAAASAKKPSQPVAVALPPQLLKQTSSTGTPSPHVTPALPKAPTPNRQRQPSQQNSHGSSPKTPHATLATSKSTSPSSQSHAQSMPRSILTKPPVPQQAMSAPHGQPSSPMPPMGPPPGMPGPPGLGMASMPPGLNGFANQASMMPGIIGPRPSMPFFPQPSPQSFRGFPPPGMHTPGTLPMGRGFPMEGPPGFAAPPGFTTPMPSAFPMGMPSHSRQGSGSFDRLSNVESPIAAPQAQPIQRPTPIKRPSSVKPGDEPRGSDVDELASHLGSKALLDDEDDMPELPDRRPSLQQHGSVRAPSFGFADMPGSQYGSFGAPGGGSIWGTPPLQGFNSGATWGHSPTSNVFNSPFSTRVHERSPNEQRIVWLRRTICAACKTLAPRASDPEGYVDASEVHRHVDASRNALEPAVSMEEMKEACDILDVTQTNGGGSLEYKEDNGRLSHIKFSDSAPAPPPLGEIGSPVPSHSVLAGGFGRFPGLGPQGF